MGQQIETKPYFFNNELKLIAIVKTKVEEETQTVERKTHLMNVNGEKVLDISEYNMKTAEGKTMLKVNSIKCFDNFFVIEVKKCQSQTEKVCYKAYSYHGKLLQAEPHPWNNGADKEAIDTRMNSYRSPNFE